MIGVFQVFVKEEGSVDSDSPRQNLFFLRFSFNIHTSPTPFRYAPLSRVYCSRVVARVVGSARASELWRSNQSFRLR